MYYILPYFPPLFRFHIFVNFVILAPVLLNHLLSVSHANSVDDDSDRSSLVETNIAGYLVVYANTLLYLFNDINYIKMI